VKQKENARLINLPTIDDEFSKKSADVSAI